MKSSTISMQATEPQGGIGTSQAGQTPGTDEDISSSVGALNMGVVESPTSMNPTSSVPHTAEAMLLSGHEARAFPGIFSRSIQNYKA